ncbi:hypothetical protein C8Q75DRAFT_85509 [Abortiporus biennis]|nr:hypothetical protein C8Q75DRAFT_85509 [Abortiporus biennis]
MILQMNVNDILDKVVSISQVSTTVIDAVKGDPAVAQAIARFHKIPLSDEEEAYRYVDLETICNIIVSSDCTSTHANSSLGWRFLSNVNDLEPETLGEEYDNNPRAASDGAGLFLLPATAGQNQNFWRNVKSFIDITVHEQYSPYSTSKDTTVEQVLDHHLDRTSDWFARNPFKIFSLSIQIFGSKFFVMWVDRNHCLLSPERPMFDEHDGVTEDFIRVILRFTRLNEYQLGDDPTASIILDGGPSDYPSFRVTMGSRNHDKEKSIFCITEGEPLWSSISLFDNGTSVWKAKTEVEGKVIIVKNTWKKRSRNTTLCDVLNLIGLREEGIGSIVDDPDVHIHIPVEAMASINSIRNRHTVSEFYHQEGDMLGLHRVFLSTVGKPLWNTRSRATL